MSLTWLFSDPSAKSRAQAPIALKNVRVASPCRADWTQMSGDARVRHCAECKLNVYNLSEMSRREAEELIASHEGRLCVRFYRRADGTVLTRDCPVGLRQIVRKVSRVAGTALSALMSVAFCAAQSPPNSTPQATKQNDQKTTGALITATDGQGAAVSGAEVSLKMTSSGKWFITKTDRAGAARFTIRGAGTYEVQINSQGFRPYRANMEIMQDRMVRTNVKLVKLVVGEELMGFIVSSDSPLINKTQSTVSHTFEGDLLRAGSPR